MQKQIARTSSALVALLTVVACSSSSSDGEGTATFTTWGEEYIEREIPASTVADGWTIHYEKFLVNVGNVTVADANGNVAARMNGSKIFDHTKPGVKPVVRFANIAAKAWPRVSYEILPATATSDGSDVPPADKDWMVQGGYSIYVDATATKGTLTKKYRWGFKTHTLYDRCKGDLSGKETDGTVITNGGTDTMQLTIHGDHFYYDDLQAPEAKVRFDAIANADKDNDGIVTLDELATVKRAEIHTADIPYGAGEEPNIVTLQDFVTALSRTIGHFRGEGECFASKR
ncbi:MAG: hypothetical protein U0174_26785 [Polyangiaceae bacterium]